jgi:peptide/nickel transport system permease protein
VTFATVVLLLALLALAAPLVSRYVTHIDPTQQDLTVIFGPLGTTGHLLGTDELGRDVFTRLIWGSRVSLGVGFLTVTLCLVAGFYGGIVGELLMRLVDTILAIPVIFLLILVTSVLPIHIGPLHIEHDAVSISIVIAITSWGGVARLVRAEVLAIKSREFITATRSIGATGTRIIVRHLLPNVLPVIIVTGSLGLGQIILVEAALDFIGLGVRPPTPTWGNMLFNSQSYFYHSTSLVTLPGLCILVAVLAANIVGNAVRDAFDPRLR